jgi:predicted nucleic acid-binding Zn ribbon protein
MEFLPAATDVNRGPNDRLYRGKFLFIFAGLSNRIECYVTPCAGSRSAVKKDRTKSIGELLPNVLKGLGLEQKLEEVRLRDEWRDVVGEAIGGRSRPLKIRGNTLIVEVVNSTWMNEIQFHRGEIIRKVNRGFPGLKIEEIRLQLERERERE